MPDNLNDTADSGSAVYAIDAETGAPIVVGRWVRSGRWRGWRITCPYCGQSHHHGNPPGHRTSHCGSNRPIVGDRSVGYVIVAPEGWSA